MPNPGHSQNDNTCISVFATTKRYAAPPEKAMQDAVLDLYRMRKLAALHQHAMKQDVINQCTMVDAGIFTLSRERNNFTLSHSPSESCSASSFARFARSGSSLAICETKVSTDWKCNQHLMLLKENRFSAHLS